MPPKRKESTKNPPTLKRTKTEKLKLQPEEKQIYKGLRFCFARNDDIDQARRMRQNKAREYGAECEMQFNDEITHIIVDKDLKYENVLDILNIERVPSRVIIVNHDYVGACIAYKRLLDPDQTEYEVSGTREARNATPPLPNHVVPSTVSPPSAETSEPSSPINSFHSDTTCDSVIVPPTPSPVVVRKYDAISATAGNLKIEGLPLIKERFLKPLDFVDDYSQLDNEKSSPPKPARQVEVRSSPPLPPKRVVTPVLRHAKTDPIPSRSSNVECKARVGKDELSQIIETIDRDVDISQYLDDSDKAQDDDSDTDGYNSEAEEAARKAKSKKGKATSTGSKDHPKGHWQNGFQCMKQNGAIDATNNPNFRTIQILSEMLAIYEAQDEHWRTMAYRKAIRRLKETDVKIYTKAQAIGLYGIGNRLAEKIEEIVQTDKLGKLEYAKNDPVDQLVEVFCGVYGIGDKTARKFVAAGYKSLEDLKQRANISDAMRQGIKYYDDLKKRIPRDEVTEHKRIVEKALRSIDEAAVMSIMGSYRRGKDSCGDIDIIITKEGAGTRELRNILDQLIKMLIDQGVLLCHLAAPNRSSDDGSKWHGISRVAEYARRIDFLIVPSAEIGAALLYFTGDDIFNRSMRLLASKKGMRLNQRGLYSEVMRGPGRQKFNDGTLLESRSERRIFEILEVPYRNPQDRVCS